ncbi:hypothetical protein HID58_037297 [Brassica napus]|uniref:(rape) hypothetical protein n=1 Tax=Brassica napus TaxID=3708 RepID=A0A817ASU4_BRANA|nr:protein NETWORKED 1D [Brassica napus]KAH0905470.1 hypothetical protein HID58_037297 [Brassica napus]CAF2308889.1 unnamed protein product [Brassica napus]
MAAFANANTKRYSWWWDSHISPKNSKWLQENLTDMDSKVKQMIKVIEEDADSFARRAEMYYKKRPELMKLVEEFYRAYRALAERYDHATGVIRHAQQTMAEAFPNQDPMMFGEESLVGPSTEEFDPQTPESYPPIRAPVYPSDLKKGALGISSSHMSTVKRNIAFMEDPQGLKIGKARRGLNFNDADGNGRNAKVLSESERASKAEAEIVALKDALAKVQAEKEANLAQFDQNLERLTNMESEVSRAQEDSRCFCERATRAEAEVETLRETLSKLEVEKESSLLQYQQCLENIADLEERISLAQKEANERASQAEGEIIALKQSLVGLETDKEAALVQYQQCLETISNLEERLRKAEEDARLINQRAENADGEVEILKEKVSKLTQENEAYELQYQQCLETIADLKLKLFHAQEETQRLSREIEDGIAKLKFAEEKCVVLERSNQNLNSELDGLLEKLENQSHELTEKQKEMGTLWTTVQEEHLRFVEAETAFQTLQQLHSQSQEELNTLALELQNKSEILKDLEACNSGLLEEVQEAKEESKSLNELNLASAASIKSLQEEVLRLRETIQKLEAEVELRVDQRNALQQEIYCLKEELSQMGKKHQSMVEGFGSSIKELQEENSKLNEINERESIEKITLLEKLELMKELVEKNLLLENSISDLNSELETIRGKLKTLEEAFAEEKSGLHSEKNMLVSRLESATEDSKKLSEENRLLENSLFDANAELEELKSKLKSLEDSCHLLSDDKSSLVGERESLLSRMDIMRKNIEDLEKEQAELKVKVLESATEKESCLQKIEELGVSLNTKDSDYTSFVQLSESRMNGMKSKIHHLQDENQRKERVYQEELDRAHDAHVEIIVLKKCFQEWLEKSSSLVAENQSLKQAAHLLEKLVSELEQENSGKQVQIDSSVDCIKVLRTGIFQVLMKLEVIPGFDFVDENSQDQKNIHEMLSRLDEIQGMLLKIQRENHQGTIENLVLVEFIRQLKSEAVGLATGKKVLEKENESQRSQLLLLQDEIQKLICMNGELNTKVNQGVDREEVLKVEVEDVHRQSAIENLVLVEFLKQLKSEASGITTEKKALEEELESKRSQLLLSLDEAQELGYMIRELTRKVNQGVSREEVLKVEVDDLHKQSAIENLVLVEFLQQLRSEATGIATEKSVLEEKLESHRDQLSFSRNETKNLSHMNGELTTKVNQGINREEVLKVEIEDVHRQSAIEKLVHVEFLHQLKSEAVSIATEKKSLEEELESKSFQLSLLRDEAKNLSHMIEELTTKVNQGVYREEVLKVENEDLQMLSAIENLVLVEFLRSHAVGIATKKRTLEQELQSQLYLLSFSQDETKKLSHMIEELTTEVNQGVNREQVLKVEVDDIHMQSVIDNLVLVESLKQLKSEAVGVATEKTNLEEELESQCYQLLFSQDETKKLTYMIGELTTKVNQGLNREERLKVEVDDLHWQSAIENLVLVEFLQQLKSEAVGIATEKNTLEEELESQRDQLLSLRVETKNLIYMIEELTTKVNQGVNREEVLKVENEDLHMQSAIKNLVLVESLCQLKSEAVGIATEKKLLEEELESQRYKLSLSRDETKNLINMNGELATKVNQGVNREEVLHRQVLQLRNDYVTLQGENYKTLDDKRRLTKSTLRLEEEKRKLEDDISLLLSETIYQSNLIILLENLVLEKLSEAVKLNEDLDMLSFVKCKLEEEVREVGDKLKCRETENLQLGSLLEKTDAELLSARSANDQLEHEIADVKDELVQKEKELLEAMLMISVVQSEKSELSKAVEDLECRYKEAKAIEEDKDKQVLKLQGDYEEQVKKTGHANEANMKLEADLLNLLMELEGIKAEKEKLNRELSKEKSEVEVWESQASTLFRDLQISAVSETLLQGLTYELAEAYNNLENRCTLKDVEIDQLNQKLSKEKNEVEQWESQASTLFGDLQILVVHKTLLEGLVHELVEAYNNLESRCTRKDVEIDQLKGRVNNLEDANKGQEDLMRKYFQAIILLKESIESLEKHIDMPHELEDEPPTDTASMVDNNKEGFLELEEMCLRIKAIEEALTKKLAVEELRTSARRSRRRSGSLRKQNNEIYSQESEMITKDIVLDQVSDCSSYGISKRDILKIEDDHSFEAQTGKSLSEESLVVDKLEISDRFTDPNKEVNKRKVLERLHSDLQKLSNLHIAVEDLKSKVEREETSEKGKEDEYEAVKGQIHEAEEALEKLLSVNRKLVTKVISGFEISDGSKSSVDLDEDERSRRRKISEQARRGSEKIGRLQFEIQRLQFLLLKLEGEREDRAKAKTSDSKTRTLLKDYIYGGVRGERRKRIKKRFAFCGCVQQPPPSP